MSGAKPAMLGGREGEGEGGGGGVVRVGAWGLGGPMCLRQCDDPLKDTPDIHSRL